MRPYNSDSGFSLVELILVMMIIGILSAIAIPKIGDLIVDTREKAVAERLIEDLNFLRSMAVSHHDTTWMVVNVAANEYGLYSGPTAGTRVLIPDPQSGESAVLDLDTDYPNIYITSASFGGSSEVSFDWWGNPSAGGTMVLNGDRTITLVSETGLAHETP